MDSGATKHMYTERKAFTNLNKNNQPYILPRNILKYSQSKSIGAGEVILHARLNKHEKNPVKLKDTLCVLGLIIFYP